MHTVEEIESAIDHLPPEEYRRFLSWMQAREQKQWDAQMDQDSVSGKLDFLFTEAESEAAKEKLRDWPSPS